MIRVFCAVTLAAVASSATIVLAQQNPILARQEIMKKSDDDLKAVERDDAQGEAPYDAAKVTAAYASMEDSYKKGHGLFPDNSKTGDKTRASPKVWENRADFDAKMAAFIKVAGEAKAKATNEEAFKEIHPAVIKGCDNCHEDYRMRRQP